MTAIDRSDALAQAMREFSLPSSIESKARAVAAAGQQAATIARPPRVTLPRLAVALGSAALALAFLTFTQPGRALAQQIGELIGIVEPASIDQKAHLPFDPSGPAVALATGTAPDGVPFEIVAYEEKGPGAQERAELSELLPGREPGLDEGVSASDPSTGPRTCLGVDIQAPRASAAGIGCTFEPDRRIVGMDYLSPYPRIGEAIALQMGGPTQTEVARVEVAYDNGHRLVQAPTTLGVLTPEIAAEIGTEQSRGYWTAFLPRRAQAGIAAGRAITIRDALLIDSITITAVGAQGTILRQIGWGHGYLRNLKQSRGEYDDMCAKAPPGRLLACPGGHR
jgi:hypothetical protein